MHKPELKTIKLTEGKIAGFAATNDYRILLLKSPGGDGTEGGTIVLYEHDIRAVLCLMAKLEGLAARDEIDFWERIESMNSADDLPLNTADLLDALCEEEARGLESLHAASTEEERNA